MINWQVVATISAPIIALFLGFWINRRFESRSILQSYFGHISAFRGINIPNVPDAINTHSVILGNVGSKTATNIRISHNFLPNFFIWPQIQHHTENLPGGGVDIVIPRMVPKEVITISYLYLPPTVATDIHLSISSDQGFANQIQVIMQRVLPNWSIQSLRALVIIGIISIIYLLYIFISHFF